MIFALIKSLVTPGAPASLAEESDEALMLLYAQGEVAAFELLVVRHEKGLFNFILRSCKRPDVAQELLQEVFMRVIKSAQGYQQKAKFTTWVYTIARNLCIDRARRKSSTHELSLDKKVGQDDDGASFADLVVDEHAQAGHMSYERKQFLERLHQALEQIPPDQREVFMLKEVSGLKFREIAEIVDAPIPTVKSRMRYALESLRGHLAQYADVRFDEEERKEVVRSGE